MGTPSLEVSNQRNPFIPPDSLITKLISIFLTHKNKQEQGINGELIEINTANSFNSLKNLRNLSQQEKTFLRNYDIKILGRVGNSFNIEITDLNDVNGTTKVLTIAKQMSTNTLLPDDIRQMAVTDGALAPKEQIPNPGRQSVNISLSHKYQGSFESLYERKRLAVADRHIQCAINIRKMAEKLQDFQASKIFFPDAKVTNWLLDENNDPIVTDDKSLRTYSQAIEQASHKGINSFVHTEPYWPQNLTSTSISRDSDFENIHAYTLGSNIYDYLTGREPPEGKLSDANFSKPVFQGEIGIKYKRLIENLRSPNPSARMSLAKASQVLLDIQYNIENKKGLSQNPEVISQRKAHREVTNVYAHAKEAKENRYLGKNVTVPAVDEQKLAKFKNFKGDFLKTRILISLQREIDKVVTKEELAELKEKIKKSPEYRVLETYQGLIQNKSAKGTKSVQALNELFDIKESSLLQAEVDNPMRSSLQIGKTE